MKMIQNVFEELSCCVLTGTFFENLSQVKAEKSLDPRVLSTSIFTPFSVFQFLFHYSVSVSPVDQMDSKHTSFLIQTV